MSSRLFGLALVVLAPAAFAQPAVDPLRAIAIAEDERHYPDLRVFLSASDSSLRARATLAVGRLQDSTSVADLLPLLSDPSRVVRIETAFALGQIGHPSARAALEQVLDGAAPGLAAVAIEALGKIGDRAATPRVTRYLHDPSPALRAEAAVALWRLADSTALDRLIEHHGDPDPEVRWRVLYATEKLVSPERVVRIAALHLDDREGQVRAQAARTLGRQKSTLGTAYLLQKLADPEPQVIVNALRGLQLIADSTCGLCPGSLAEVLAHPHPYVRVTAATVLVDRFAWAAADTASRRQLLDSLVVRLHDPDPATRGAAAHALLAARGEEGLEPIQPLLGDSSLYVRAAALRALAAVPTEPALALLLPRLDPGTALIERMAAIETIGELKTPSAVERLRAGLADSTLLIVAVSAAALAEIGDSASVPDLARAYRARAADSDPDARISIRDALRRLAGRSFADSIERAHVPGEAGRRSYADDFHVPPDVRGAVLETAAGEIEWEFFVREAPQTVRNFARLAEQGYFDGRAVHRVVPNFVIQDGDPTGTGWGGPGWTIRCEYNRLRYQSGMVGMALSGKDTGGSQWFITHSPQPHLDGRYTIFARVVRGMDVVHRIVQGDRVLRSRILR